ncbi:MAG: SLOG family protein [Oscillospiraceae bacterium]
MSDKELKCAFTGHRENKLGLNWHENSPEYELLRQQLYDAVQNVYLSGIHHFICGMAHGCDLYFAEAVLSLKSNHPDVVLEAAIPYAGQANGWNTTQRRKYDAVLARCDLRTVLQQTYTRDCMMRRNKYMVDSASVLIAVYNGSPGGTRNTLLYAMRQGLEIIEIEI